MLTSLEEPFYDLLLNKTSWEFDYVMMPNNYLVQSLRERQYAPLRLFGARRLDLHIKDELRSAAQDAN